MPCVKSILCGQSCATLALCQADTRLVPSSKLWLCRCGCGRVSGSGATHVDVWVAVAAHGNLKALWLWLWLCCGCRCGCASGCSPLCDFCKTSMIFVRTAATAAMDQIIAAPTPCRNPPPWAPCVGAFSPARCFGWPDPPMFMCRSTTRDRCTRCDRPCCYYHARRIWKDLGPQNYNGHVRNLSIYILSSKKLRQRFFRVLSSDGFPIVSDNVFLTF
jgi:hypothetical protein